MQPRSPDSPRKLLPTLALVGSLPFVWGCPEAPPAGIALPRPSAEEARELPARTVAASPAPPPATASEAALDPHAVAALKEQLEALDLRPRASAEPLPDLPERPCAASFCVRLVDDAADPLRKLADGPLPNDARLVETQVPAGTPGGGRVARLQLLAPASSSPAALGELARLAAPHLPPRRELVWGPSEDPDGKPVIASYLLGPAVIDASDVASSERAQFVAGGHAVTVVLKPEGARRFGELTAKMLQRRLAVVAAGRVRLAPVVQSPIPGGRLSVAFPSEAEARAFERLLATKR